MKEFSGVEFDSQTSDGFEPWLNTKEDRQEAHKHGVKPAHLRAIIKKNAYTKFSSKSLEAGLDIFERRFQPEKAVDDFCYEGFYAAIHDDKHIPQSHQYMFAISNGGHRLYSEDFGMIVPKAGDIIHLNTYRLHAVFPAPGVSASKCLKNPFRFYAVTYRRN